MTIMTDTLPNAAPPRMARALPGLVWALGFAWLPLSGWLDEFADTAHLLTYEAVWWLAALILLLYVRKVEHRPFDSVGLMRPRLRDIALGSAAGVALLAIMAALYLLVLPALHLPDRVASTTNANLLSMTPLWWRLISSLRAAVAEELMFRGYAMERLRELSGSRWIGLWASCAVFTFAHVGTWGWSHVIVVATGGLALSLLYLWRRNLWVNITAHFVVDAVSVLG
jgi:membrane protease YdiL (CAAX protease family)